MRSWQRVFWAPVVLVFSLFLASSAFSGEQCYMYTPAGYQGMGGDSRIGPYPSRDSCQSVNNDNFGGNGRCDCETTAEVTDSYAPAAGYASSGPSRRQIQAQAEQEQQRQWAEEARRQEESRQRLAAEEAKKSAEAARKKLEWEQNKAKLMTTLKGSAPGDFKLKTGGEEIQLKPKGTDFFDTWLNQGHLGDMHIKTTVMDRSKQTPPSAESENRRRSLWLYQKAATAKNSEEAAFLSQQADEAAQGHPLLVQVPDAEKMPELSPEQFDRFEKLAESVRRDEILIQKVEQKRTLVEQKQTIMKDKLKALEQKIEESKKAPKEPARPPAQEESKPEAKPEKAKGGEDLMAEYLALQKEIEKTGKEAKDLLEEQDKAKQSLEKNQKNLGSFLGEK